MRLFVVVITASNMPCKSLSCVGAWPQAIGYVVLPQISGMCNLHLR
jgi:hypothetical protein